MLHPSTKKLIDRLAEMTADGTLAWEEHPAGTPVYETEGYTVTLSGNPVELLICNRDGMEVERAAADALAATPSLDGGTYGDLLTDMRIEALRLARGTETAISTLLERLKETTSSAQDQASAPAPADEPEPAPQEPVEAELADPVPAPDTGAQVVASPDEQAAGPESPPIIVEDGPAAPAIAQPSPVAEAPPAPLSADETEMAEAVAKLADTVNGGNREEQTAASEEEPLGGETETGPAAAKFTYLPFGLQPTQDQNAVVGSTDMGPADDASAAEPSNAATPAEEVFAATPEADEGTVGAFPDPAAVLELDAIPSAAEADPAPGEDSQTPEAGLEQVRERIIIDATDDLPAYQPSENDWPKPAESDAARPQDEPVASPAPDQTEATQEGLPEDAETIRPRFNPWT